MQGYVYFVACAEPECRKAHPFIKIGQTIKLKNRLSTLQIGSPVELKFVGFIRWDEPKQLEYYFHQAFNKAWLYGEWYRLSDDIIKAIRQYNVIDDRFDEFFTELPKHDIDPTLQGWKDLAASLEEEIARLNGSNSPRHRRPTVRPSAVRRYEAGKTNR